MPPHYTLYWSPADYPGRYVIRGHSILPGRTVPHVSPYWVGYTRQRAERMMPPGYVWMERFPEDEKQICGTWV